MQEKNNSSNKNKLNLKDMINSNALSSFSSALMAIAIGLIFGFLVMVIAAPGNAIEGLRYDKSIAFGDTSGDKPMLSWADESYFRFFH